HCGHQYGFGGVSAESLDVSGRDERIFLLIEADLAGLKAHLCIGQNGRTVQRHDSPAIFESRILGSGLSYTFSEPEIAGLHELNQVVRLAVESAFRAIGGGLLLAGLQICTRPGSELHNVTLLDSEFAPFDR